MNKEQQIIEWFDNNSKQFTNVVGYQFSQLPISFTLMVYKTLTHNARNNTMDVIDLFHITKRVLVYSTNGDISNYCAVFFDNLQSLLIKKNRDYGNSFDRSIKKFGWIYLAIELDKKKNRLHNLLKSKSEPNYESIEDTLLDIAGYCVLAIIYLDNNKE